jgi:hypothetical protein
MFLRGWPFEPLVYPDDQLLGDGGRGGGSPG